MVSFPPSRATLAAPPVIYKEKDPILLDRSF
jgi:hypothetical protein